MAKAPGWNKQGYSPLANDLITGVNELVAGVSKTVPRALTCARGMLLLIFVFGVFAATAARAQVLYGTLTGTVTDPSGAAIPGAQIVALEVQTGISQTVTGDSSGNYRFTALLPGTYKVTITASGFATQETNGVLVRVNETARVDAPLKVGSATQNVVVTTEAPILQTDRADVHTDLTSQQISNLPVMRVTGAQLPAPSANRTRHGTDGRDELACRQPAAILINANASMGSPTRRSTHESTARRMRTHGCRRTLPMSHQRTQLKTSKWLPTRSTPSRAWRAARL